MYKLAIIPNMSYFGFLVRFVILPILLLLGVHLWLGKNRPIPPHLRTYSPAGVILAHSLIALIYTTPWDNYLVATGVWWYNPELVTGILFGYVPLEEYTFFVLQPLLTGLWLFLLLRLLPSRPLLKIAPRSPSLAGWVALAVWGVALFALLSNRAGWQYLSITIVWAFIPILIQLFFAADLLWYYRGHVLLGIAVPTLYLAWADSLAITATTWTIDPRQSTGVMIGVLPFEELFFFFITNTLVVFGSILVLARASTQRIDAWVKK